MRLTGSLIVLVGLLVGCIGPSTSPTAPDSTVATSTSTLPPGSTTSVPATTTPTVAGTPLRVGTTVHFNSLDPADAISFGDLEILQAVGDGPLRREPGDGALIPGIAEDAPQVSDDGLTYTFQIRPDVEFADGMALTAEGYVGSIERVMELGGRGSDLVSLFVAGVEAADESTVQFHLHDRYAFFPTLLAGAAYLPVHPDAYPAEQIVPLPETPVYGVGPWYIESYSEAEMVLEPNPYYFGDTVDPGRIVIRVYETTEEMADALTNGEVDVIWRGLDAETATSLSDVDGVVVESVPGGTLHFLTVNHGLEPTDDPQVRRALAELINRETISETVLGGAYVPVFSPVPPGYVGSSDVFRDTYGDPEVEEAINLLVAAGYTESNPARIELGFPPERFGLDIATAMEEIELQIEATGLVDVTLTSQPWETYVGDVVEGVYNIAFLGYLHDFPDPHNYLAPFVLNGGLGGSGVNLESPELTDLVADAALESDDDRRAELYEEIQTLYAQDVVTIPLWIDHPYIAYRESVSGSQVFENPETLNVGQTLKLDFRTIKIEG